MDRLQTPGEVEEGGWDKGVFSFAFSSHSFSLLVVDYITFPYADSVLPMTATGEWSPHPYFNL